MNLRSLFMTIPRPQRTRRSSIFTLSLVIALLTVSCAQAPTTEAALPEVIAPTVQTQNTEIPALTEAPVVSPVVTPRGDALEATDPTTVALASGGLQLVEFFRFT